MTDERDKPILSITLKPAQGDDILPTYLLNLPEACLLSLVVETSESSAITSSTSAFDTLCQIIPRIVHLDITEHRAMPDGSGSEFTESMLGMTPMIQAAQLETLRLHLETCHIAFLVAFFSCFGFPNLKELTLEGFEAKDSEEGLLSDVFSRIQSVCPSLGSLSLINLLCWNAELGLDNLPNIPLKSLQLALLDEEPLSLNHISSKYPSLETLVISGSNACIEFGANSSEEDTKPHIKSLEISCYVLDDIPFEWFPNLRKLKLVSESKSIDWKKTISSLEIHCTHLEALDIYFDAQSSFDDFVDALHGSRVQLTRLNLCGKGCRSNSNLFEHLSNASKPIELYLDFK